MNILITGTSSGIGRAAALEFLNNGHNVFGIDIKTSSISDGRYVHFAADISKKRSLPNLPEIEVLINNAGIQTGTEKDISVNLLGTMNVTEKYGFNDKIKSVLFIASVSALNGNEFASYVASKSGVVGYMRHCAIKLANTFHATCNALCFGGVLTELNKPVIEDKNLWNKIMDVTPLKKWMTAEEAAKWCYFMTCINTFCTGQAIDISGGERNCADLFVWPEKKASIAF